MWPLAARREHEREFTNRRVTKMNMVARVLACVAVLALSACAMTSEGLELKLDDSNTAVTFDWRRIDDVSGDVTAWLADGRSFRGPYRQDTGGSVLADLGAADGEHMRCEFRLKHPASGTRDGGRGQCRLTGGKNIAVVF